jgi:hypothetical protein
MVLRSSSLILDVLSNRLRKAELNLPNSSLHFELTWKFAFDPGFSDLARKIHKATAQDSKNRRSHFSAVAWPCDIIPAVWLAIRLPSPKSVAIIVEFFSHMANLESLFHRGREIPEAFHKSPPFLALALAKILSRRLKDPYDSIKRLSEAELWFASMLWGWATSVRKEIQAEFQREGIAGICPQCGHLYTDLALKYCSASCGAAFRRAKSYAQQSERNKTRQREWSRKDRETKRLAWQTRPRFPQAVTNPKT